MLTLLTPYHIFVGIGRVQCPLSSQNQLIYLQILLGLDSKPAFLNIIPGIIIQSIFTPESISSRLSKTSIVYEFTSYLIPGTILHCYVGLVNLKAHADHCMIADRIGKKKLPPRPHIPTKFYSDYLLKRLRTTIGCSVCILQSLAMSIFSFFKWMAGHLL